MDESSLLDLLECSVCLERLDTTAKVLPCQHTFCRRCLESIVSSRHELRCPECRILVGCGVDELPANILLFMFRQTPGAGQVPSRSDRLKSLAANTVCLFLQPTLQSLAFRLDIITLLCAVGTERHPEDVLLPERDPEDELLPHG
ncbi:hypothetical protein Q9966_011789 [Columba livia]|nr:hypothetical protein Q9966_011789 [Columba livia]